MIYFLLTIGIVTFLILTLPQLLQYLFGDSLSIYRFRYDTTNQPVDANDSDRVSVVEQIKKLDFVASGTIHEVIYLGISHWKFHIPVMTFTHKNGIDVFYVYKMDIENKTRSAIQRVTQNGILFQTTCNNDGLDTSEKVQGSKVRYEIKKCSIEEHYAKHLQLANDYVSKNPSQQFKKIDLYELSNIEQENDRKVCAELTYDFPPMIKFLWLPIFLICSAISYFRNTEVTLQGIAISIIAANLVYGIYYYFIKKEILKYLSSIETTECDIDQGFDSTKESRF